MSKTKLPAYGKKLQARLHFKNPPFIILVCVGVDAWQSAKQWNKNGDISALVLIAGQKPEALAWPVNELNCVIDWSTGPSNEYIMDLVKVLLKAGALTVTARPTFVDHSQPSYFYDATRPLGQRWSQTREVIRTYHNPLTNKKGSNVA